MTPAPPRSLPVGAVYRLDERTNDAGLRFATGVKRTDGRPLTRNLLTDKTGR